MDFIQSNNNIKKIILKNILKMIINRGYKCNDKLDNILKNSKNNIFKIKLDNNIKIIDNFFNEIIVIITNQKIQGITKSPLLKMFLTEYSENYKIIVCKSITEKAKNNNKIKYTEFFLETFFMLDILSHYYSPKYTILDKNMSNKFKEEYNVKNDQIMKININDPISKYYNLKINDIIRIERNNKNIKSIAYRIVSI